MLSTTTPALLFPAISLLLLAYTNRFMVLAQLIRQLNRESSQAEVFAVDPGVLSLQLTLLRRRIDYIRYMQALGILSFIACTASMFMLLLDYSPLGLLLFATSLIVLVLSLCFALVEVLVSTKALMLEIGNHV